MRATFALRVASRSAAETFIAAAVALSTLPLMPKPWYHQQRALSLNPNNDLIVVQNGEMLTWMGEPEQGIEWIKKAMRLNPHHPERFWSHLGRAYFVARRYREAIDSFRRLTKPDQFQHAEEIVATIEAEGFSARVLDAPGGQETIRAG